MAMGEVLKVLDMDPIRKGGLLTLDFRREYEFEINKIYSSPLPLLNFIKTKFTSGVPTHGYFIHHSLLPEHIATTMRDVEMQSTTIKRMGGMNVNQPHFIVGKCYPQLKKLLRLFIAYTETPEYNQQYINARRMLTEDKLKELNKTLESQQQKAAMLAKYIEQNTAEIKEMQAWLQNHQN